jgi:DNA-binding response OmpR family regulator
MSNNANVRQLLISCADSSFALSLGGVLEAHGFVTTQAGDEADALRLAERIRPDVIILDGGNGFETCRAMRAEAWGHAVFLIAYSSSANLEQRSRALEEGFDLVFAKGRDPLALAVIIEEAMR